MSAASFVYALYFGPDSIWVHKYKREPGWWVIYRNPTHTWFHGPFDEEDEANVYARSNPYDGGGRCKYKDQTILGTSPAPVHELTGTQPGLEQRSIDQLINEFSIYGDPQAQRMLLRDCLRSILAQHPRSDMRIVLEELIEELADAR